MRFVSIELLRTVAITLMVQVHFVENLAGVIGLAPPGFAAPMFTFLSGVSYRLWLVGQRAKGVSNDQITKVSLRRGLFLIGVGFLFNVFVWMPEDTFNWDILTFIGLALVALALVRELPPAVPIAACGLIYLISPVLRRLTDYPAYWTNLYFEHDLTLSDVVLGCLVNGYFPLFPWLIFPLAGYVTARFLFPESERAPRVEWVLPLAGAAAAAVAIGLALAQRAWGVKGNPWLAGWTMFPASTQYIAGTLAIVWTALGLTRLFVDRRGWIPRESPIGRVAATFGNHSFTVYLLHHVVHLWPMWLVAVAHGQEPTAYWGQATSAYIAWPLAVVFLAGCYFALRLWRRYDLPTIETLMRWICD